MSESNGRSTGRLLMRAMKLHRGRVHATLHDLGLYRGQARILRVLWREEGIAQSEIAERAWVRPATMTSALQRMEQVGLVERRPDPDDQRRSLVYLTRSGEELEEPVNQALADVESEMLAGLSPVDTARFRSCLSRVVDNLEEQVKR